MSVGGIIQASGSDRLSGTWAVEGSPDDPFQARIMAAKRIRFGKRLYWGLKDLSLRLFIILKLKDEG